ncbi:uncharacterized protein LOC124436855 [Xenia sp. Carnegie-2017]|uniref:uncharacterized protein LOC124436855 n=1 Tax=Xenia sp. Carnegie-2017 TaxID=2897299 RepID=UPI001F04734B|nr:uncharacterized protein LOC124436855 [Xenia sp. Carnegie-2017]
MSQIKWINGVCNNRKVERICPERHVQQKEWKNPEWNQGFRGRRIYHFISDYECPFPYKNHMPVLDELSEKGLNILQSFKQQGYPIAINNLVHCTDNKDDIIISHGFIGREKKINEINGKDIYADLCWWAPLVEEDDKKSLRAHMGNCFLKVFDHDIETINDIKDLFGISLAFEVYSIWKLYKTCRHYFQYSMDDLLEYYQGYIGDEKIEFRILGTFAYKVKVEYNVLVCSESAGKNEFSQYPHIQESNVVRRDSEGNWKWYPQATGKDEIKRFDGSKDPEYRRYDCVSFAFHVPKEKHLRSITWTNISIKYNRSFPVI